MRVKFSRISGEAQSGCWTVLTVLFLIVMGGNGVYTAYKNPAPTVMGYEEFIKNRPAARWLVLTNCTLDLPAASGRYRIGNKEVKSVSAPVLGKNQDPYVRVVFSTKNPMLCRSFGEILRRSESSTQSALSWISSNTQHAYPKMDLRGMVEIIKIDNTSAKKEDRPYADDVVYINDGETPSMAFNLTMLSIGLIWGVVGFRKWRKDDGLVARS
jgi:hypothetical protein